MTERGDRGRRDDLGAFLRHQREAAQLSLRQLAARAGVSNPYLSQVERGLRRPSAEVLQQLARALEISSAALYGRAAGDDQDADPAAASTGDSAVVRAVLGDPRLVEHQRRALIDVYTAFVSTSVPGAVPVDRPPAGAAAPAAPQEEL